MNITEQTENDVTTIYVSGEIDGSNVGDFEKSIMAAIPGAPNLILDLGDLEYVSSAGLRVFLMSQKKQVASGHSMVIRNVNDDVMEIFSITGFVKLLNIDE